MQAFWDVTHCRYFEGLNSLKFQIQGVQAVLGLFECEGGTIRLLERPLTTEKSTAQHVRIFGPYAHWIRQTKQAWSIVNEARRKIFMLQHFATGSVINLYATCVLYIGQAFRFSPENAFYIFNQKYISLSNICLTCISDINNIDNQLDATITAY